MIKMITYPLNNIDYTAEDAELYFSTRESGVYDGNDFEVTVSGIDNNVTVGTGIAWIHNTKFSGKVVALKEPKILTLSLPNSVYDRIDAIVIQFDANKNATEIVVKEGIASSAPVAPNVVRTESLYELHIFHVQRKAGATVISVDDLIDLKNNSDYCGIMFDSISSIDSTLSKSGYAADAAETGKQIKRATNVRNLLDNSDFTNPVNQRGINSISNLGSYLFDRWIVSAMGSNITISANAETNGTKFTNSRGGSVCLIQRVELKNFGKKPYTACLKRANGEFVPGLIEEYDGDIKQISFWVYNNDVVEWAALYEGEYTAETLPPYVAKGYGAELAECRRYYQVNKVLVGEEASAQKRIFVTLSPQMRIIPTITFTQNGTGNPTVVAIDNYAIDVTCKTGYADVSVILTADL